MVEQLTILVADDHPIFRKGLRTLLASMPNVELIGEAASGVDAIEMAERLQPDVILMDLQMPGGGGIAAIRQIVQTSPQIRILVITMFQDDDSVFAAMRAGARLCPERHPRWGGQPRYCGGRQWGSHLQSSNC